MSPARVPEGLEHPRCEEGLGEPGLFSLERRGLRGVLSLGIYVCWGSRDEGDRLLSVVPRDRTRDNGLALKIGKFQ